MIEQVIYGLGQVVCGTLGGDANIYCLTGQNIRMIGTTALILPISAIVVVWGLARH